MAIAKDVSSKASSKGWSQSSPVTLTWAHTCTGSNLILWVAVQLYQDTAGNGTITTATYNGVALTKYKDVLTGSIYAALYYLIAPATGAHNVVITATTTAGAKIDDLFAQASSFTGVDQVTGVDASASGTGYSTTASAAVITVADNCEVIDSIAKYGANAITKGANQTELNKDASNAAGGSSYLTSLKTPAGSVTMSWTWTTAGDWSIVTASFKPATATTTIHTLSALGAGN